MWYKLLRPGLFCLDPEFSHDLSFKILTIIEKLGGLDLVQPVLPQEQKKTAVHCFGLDFANPVGLAAGLDKNAECLAAWQAMGFGFIEMGTVTPRAQLGNPKPRLFRLEEDRAIINRMGFNNKGVDALVEKIQQYRSRRPNPHIQIPVKIGVNIGKNKDTPLESAAEDYVLCYEKVYAVADYVTVNLSSPNTPGLRTLQQGESLKNILLPLKNIQDQQANKTGRKVPLLVKLAADLDNNELINIVSTLLALKIEGVIVTNTTVKRPASLRSQEAQETGGLSGAPLFRDSTDMIKKIYAQAGEALPIIAVGGIMTPEQAQEKLSAGAKLIQLYTGLIYEGPSLVSKTIHLLRKKD